MLCYLNFKHIISWVKNMEFKIGDLVTRNSYNNDMVFTIIDIKDDICYLKGINIRLYADSSMEDLQKYDENEDIEEEKPFLDRIKEKCDLNWCFA